MTNDLVPQSLWNVPGILSSALFDEDSDLFTLTSNSGLSIAEDEQNIYVEAAVPGVNPDDLDVTVNKGMLWIKGKSTQTEDQKQKRYYRKATNAFSYRVLLPSTADNSVEPEATCENGVVFVTIPKSQADKPKKVSIRPKGKKSSSEEVPVKTAGTKEQGNTHGETTTSEETK